jgi:hypothetical protein
MSAWFSDCSLTAPCSSGDQKTSTRATVLVAALAA